MGLDGNSVAILTNEGVVVFDANGTPAAAREVIAHIRRLTKQPVRYLVLSHWHWDHWYGAEVYASEFPGVVIVAHERTRALMAGPAVEFNRPGLESQLPAHIREVEAGAAKARTGLLREEAAKFEAHAAEDRAFLAAKKWVQLTLPTLTFADSLTLYLGGREIQVRHPGRAITPGAYTSAQDMRLEPKCRHEGGLRLRGICKAAEPDMPLITILTVVYNRARYLRRAIESVLSQDYHNIEYVVIDGGSTDSSLDIVKEYDHAIDYWVSEPDQGMYYALNKGIELSNGTLIGLMHSDDFLLRRDAIGIVAKVAGETVADIYHTDALLIVEKVDRCALQLMHSDDTKILQTHASILHLSSFVRKQVFKDIGSYDVRYRSASDYEFFMRCVRRAG